MPINFPTIFFFSYGVISRNLGLKIEDVNASVPLKSAMMLPHVGGFPDPPEKNSKNHRCLRVYQSHIEKRQ